MNWKKFGESFKSATGVSIAALLVLTATYGKQLVEAAVAIPDLYKAYASVLPMGMWSAFLGTLLAAGFHTFARSWHNKSLAIEVATILIGATATAVQIPSNSTASLLSALVVGVIAGMAGLFVAKLVRSIRMGNNDDKPRPNPPIFKPD